LLLFYFINLLWKHENIFWNIEVKKLFLTSMSETKMKTIDSFKNHTYHNFDSERLWMIDRYGFFGQLETIFR